jgi:hypothetical protein
MIENDRKYLEELNKKMRTIYDAIGSVFCPALQKIVVFNAKGFHHLHYRPDGSTRSYAEKIHKLRLVPLAQAVVRSALRISERRSKTIKIRQQNNLKTIVAHQYGLVATVGRHPISVRVIVMELENSQNPYFWSIMTDKKTIR